MERGNKLKSIKVQHASFVNQNLHIFIILTSISTPDVFVKTLVSVSDRKRITQLWLPSQTDHIKCQMQIMYFQLVFKIPFIVLYRQLHFQEVLVLKQTCTMYRWSMCKRFPGRQSYCIHPSSLSFFFFPHLNCMSQGGHHR